MSALGAPPGAGAVAVSFPLSLGEHGRTRTVDSAWMAAEQLIEELLFTNRGERLNRPMLGAGVLELVFDDLTDELRTVTQFQIGTALQQWLGDVIRVSDVQVLGAEAELQITVLYTLAGSSEVRRAVLSR